MREAALRGEEIREGGQMYYMICIIDMYFIIGKYYLISNYHFEFEVFWLKFNGRNGNGHQQRELENGAPAVRRYQGGWTRKRDTML